MSGLIPVPYSRLYLATRGESHGVGTGPAGFGGAGWPAAGAAGLAAGVAGEAGLAGVAGAAAFGGVAVSAGVVLVSDRTEPEGGKFHPAPGLRVSAVGLAFSGGGGVGDLISSDIRRRRNSPAQAAYERTLTFISLPETVVNFQTDSCLVAITGVLAAPALRFQLYLRTLSRFHKQFKLL